MPDDARRIAITGSTGLIGEALRQQLLEAGHDVVRVVRSRDDATGGDVYWSVDDGEIDVDGLAGVDQVVHLAGEPIGARRWTEEVKAEIHDSRTQGTALLAGALAEMGGGPDTLVSGSAVGYYGSRGDEVLTEDSAPGSDFLARVTTAWEEAARPAVDAGLRVAFARTGVVIAEHGPLIEKIRLPFKLGVGGQIGDGEQWVPWISLRDEVRALQFLLDRDVAGPANLTAPNPVRNAGLTEALGDVLDRPTVIPTPVFGIRLLYGEMGVTLATASQRALPRRLLDEGFEFADTRIRDPLRRALR